MQTLLILIFICNSDILMVEVVPKRCIFIGLVQRKISFTPYPCEIKGSLRKIFANDISSLTQLVLPKFEKGLPPELTVVCPDSPSTRSADAFLLSVSSAICISLSAIAVPDITFRIFSCRSYK